MAGLGAAAGGGFTVVAAGEGAACGGTAAGAGVIVLEGAVVSVCVPGAGALSRAEVAPPVRQMPSVRLNSFDAAVGEIALSAAASGSVRMEPTIISLMPARPKAVGFAR